jgi:outer membrane lipoprotein-sorting protein
MKRSENNDSSRRSVPERDLLDEALSKAIGSEESKPNFEKWKQDHPEAVEMLTSRAPLETSLYGEVTDHRSSFLTGRAGRASSAYKRPLNIRNIIMKSRIIKLAATAAVIIIAALIINFQFSTSGVAWGALVEKIESVESVVYRLTTNVKMQGMPQGQTPKTETIAYYSSEYGSRVENYINDKLSFTMYLNPIENVYITVMPEQKKFMRFTKSPDEIRQISDKDDPRVMVRHMMSTEYKQLGRDNINGIDVEGIECTGPKVMGGMFEEATARLWVEIGTDFPVRIEIEGIVSGGQMEMSMVMDDFQWNVELDPALFVPDIPSDYTSSEMSLSEANEGTAINGLRIFAELTDGRYPSNLALLTLMKEITEALTKKYGFKLVVKQDEYTSALVDTLQAATFYAQLVGAEKEAVYYGDSVTADDVDTVLLRWKVTDGIYHIIFGNLTTADVTEEKLAELESQQSK